MQAPGELRITWLVKAYLWATELLYGPLAWAYDAVAWLVSFGNWSRWRLDALGYLKAGSVLEIGFGTGELLLALVEGGQAVFGLELSAQMQRVTAKKLKKKAKVVKRVRAHVEAMPFPSGVFENLISTFPSNYILSRKTLAEIKRVLSAQGRCVVLGLGVQFTSTLKQCLTTLWVGRFEEAVICHFIQAAQEAGLSVTQIDHKTSAYVLPVLILERKDAD